MSGCKVTAKQAWSQFALGLLIPIPIVAVLFLLGAKAPWAAIPGVALAVTPWIEFKTTGRQPKNLAVTQLAAIGTCIGYVIFELTRWG